MKRVLFVDDESNVLDGLKRMLRSKRHEWDMAFAPSGAKALEAMEAEAFDVVVTDMRMPGMDGAGLLAGICKRSPRTVRIVLSGQADFASVLRSVGVSHQFLSKPCTAGDLVTVVDRACRLGELLQDSTLEHAVGGIGDLPVLPETYRALVEEMREEEVDLQKVGKIVERDPVITAKILQLVNSGYFGVRREITSAIQATSYLGAMTIRNLVLSAEVFRQFEGGPTVKGFSLAREQAHAFLTGRIASALMEDKQEAELAFLGGMLHDIGKLIMFSYLPEQFAEVAAGREPGEPFGRAETRLLGVGHAEIGGYLLDLWGMPYAIVEAVANHNAPSRVAEQATFGVLAAVHVADALAQEASGTLEDANTILDHELLDRLRVADQLPAWRALAAEQAGDTEDKEQAA